MIKSLDFTQSKQLESIPIYPSEELATFFLKGLPFDYFCLYLDLPAYYEDFDHDFAFNLLGYKLQENELFTNYPYDWQETYFEQELQFKDPVLTYAKHTVSPFLWGVFNRKTTQSYKVLPTIQSTDLKNLIRNSRHYGIGCGLSIPITYGSENIGLITLSSQTLPRNLTYLEITTLCAYVKAVGEYFAFYQKSSIESKMDCSKARYNITKYQQLLATKKALKSFGLIKATA